MQSRRLTIALKKEINKNVRSYVEKKMYESFIYKEQQELIATISHKFREFCENKIPNHDIDILKKYGFVNKIRKINITTVDGDIKVIWNTGVKDHVKINFDPPIILPDKYFYPDVLIDEFVSNPTSQEYDMLCLAIRANIHINCEIEATIDAYMKIIGLYTTEKKLLKKHPDFKKFLPNDIENEKQKTESKEAKSIIENFESV